MSDVDIGMKSLQYSGAAAALNGFCGYFAARQLTNFFIEESTAHNRALIIGSVGFLAIAWATVYACFVVYRASMRTKMFAMIALLISLGGGFGAWTIGWKKGGDPQTIKAM